MKNLFEKSHTGTQHCLLLLNKEKFPTLTCQFRMIHLDIFFFYSNHVFPEGFPFFLVSRLTDYPIDFQKLS